MLQRLLTIAQAAEVLSESRWTTQRRVRNGQIPAMKLGGGTAPYLLDADAVERLAAELTEVAS
jgi:excisionase family DNA binding protein